MSKLPLLTLAVVLIGGAFLYLSAFISSNENEEVPQKLVFDSERAADITHNQETLARLCENHTTPTPCALCSPCTTQAPCEACAPCPKLEIVDSVCDGRPHLSTLPSNTGALSPVSSPKKNVYPRYYQARPNQEKHQPTPASWAACGAENNPHQHADPPAPIDSGNGPSHPLHTLPEQLARRPFQTLTGTQLNTNELFRLYDEATRSRWPKNGVCLMLRAFAPHWVVLQYVLRSAEQLWPHNIGRKVLILDDGEQYLAPLVPESWTVVFETFPPGVNGRIGMQWSNFYGDKYCPTEDFIATLDSDSVFHMKVTPDLLFDADGKAYVPVSTSFQPVMWDPATHHTLKLAPEQTTMNGMITLPVVFPRGLFPAIRQHIASLHGLKDFDDFIQTVMRRGDVMGSFSQFVIMASYLWYHARDTVHMVVTETHEPILRYANHMPYNPPLLMTGTMNTPYGKRSEEFERAMMSMITSGICASLPPGLLDECGGYSVDADYWWMYDAAFSYWNNINPAIQLKVSCRHFTPLWTELLQIAAAFPLRA